MDHLTELVPIHSPRESPIVEIVLVHGLDGDPYATWGLGNNDSWTLWIASHFPRARIWSVRYRLRWSWWYGGSIPLTDRAVTTLGTLDGELRGSEIPIVFLCHSYGGLLVKQMLRSGHDRRLEYGQLVERFKGIVFFGTPHNGASIATFVSRLGSVLRSSPAISELKRNASLLRDLSSWFTNNAQFHAWKIRVFFETMNTFGVRVVDDDGNPHIPNVTPIAIDADHFAIGPRGFASQRKTRMQGWLGRRANCGFLTRTAVRATRAPNRDAPAAVRCQRRS